MTEIIRGTCLSMCPEKELVTFEIYDESATEEEVDKAMEEEDEKKKKKKETARRPKADPRKTVKSFGRSAAGATMTDPTQLRPAPVLLTTVKYLLTEIATRTDVDWRITYDFVFDRLRSVRQDCAIQRIDTEASIEILEPIVRFLVYSAQRLCERSVSEFDAKINNQHLSECLTRLLILYDERDRSSRSKKKKKEEDDNREEMEATHILIKMGDVEALRRAQNLPLGPRSGRNVRLSMEISLAWYLRNYVRVCRSIRRLPPFLICAATINLQSIRRTALKIMSTAYNSETLTFPGRKLEEILLYKNTETLRSDCERFGSALTADEQIRFEKRSFKEQAKSANPEAYYQDEILQHFLPRILYGPR